MEAAQMRYLIPLFGFNDTESPNYLYHPKQTESRQESIIYESTPERFFRSSETNGYESTTKIGSVLPLQRTTDRNTTEKNTETPKTPSALKENLLGPNYKHMMMMMMTTTMMGEV
jgi:hypothetical protein